MLTRPGSRCPCTCCSPWTPAAHIDAHTHTTDHHTKHQGVTRHGHDTHTTPTGRTPAAMHAAKYRHRTNNSFHKLGKWVGSRGGNQEQYGTRGPPEHKHTLALEYTRVNTPVPDPVSSHVLRGVP
jgi:hypothetical protein